MLAGFPQGNKMITARFFFVMKPTPIISEKKAALVIWIGAAVFTIGAMIFGHRDASINSTMDR
jgi:hypothetical protein